VPHSSISALKGNTFVVSDRRGDVQPDSRLPPHGFFADDTRFVSRWWLTVNGQPTDILSSAHVDYFVAEFFLTAPAEAFHSAPQLSIVRRRLVGDAWREELLVVNHRTEPVEAAIELEVSTDFADLFEVKDDRVRQRRIVARTGDRELVLSYHNGPVLRETRIVVSEPALVEEDAIRLRLDLDAREERAVSFLILPRTERTRPAPADPPTSAMFESLRDQRGVELEAWRTGAPALSTDGDALRHVYDRSLTDLAALRFYPHIDAEDRSLPAAGLPWFMTLFGRDSLITSYQTLPYRADLARTTLHTLAGHQGTRVDDFRDEEPGKILHEIRFGELTAIGEYPHSPYYGAADSTPLFVVVLDAYRQWTGDDTLALELESSTRQALDWIDAYGDLDRDGYVEYQARNPTSGLVNQCWKDSWNSILFADGHVAEGPIATCEIQGYVYDAKRRGARLAREVWGDEELARSLERDAEVLRERFLADFWLPERGCFALALDGDKRPVDSVTSNIGHLLWSGIADAESAASVVEHLMGDPLWSGWGVRTMATTERGYNPVEYHNGTVWPHDNSLIAAGLRRYGYRAEAARIADAMLSAAVFFEHRLPEVFAGCPRSMTHAPVEYPTASSPQAWAAGAPLLLLTTVLGLTPGADGPRCDPHLPDGIGQVALRGLAGPWGRTDLLVGDDDRVWDGRMPLRPSASAAEPSRPSAS
jgi:glycogen debranching enzyme